MSSMLLLLVLCSIVYLPSARSAELCSSVGGNNASCILLTECEPVMNLLRNSPLLRETSLLLHSLKCGYKRRVPRICCTPELQLATLVPTTTTTTTTLSPTVEYRNWDLLPHDSCGFTITQYIVGGNEADLGEFPWLALISYVHVNGRQRLACGGALINKRYVLTAAHCVHKATVHQYTPVTVRLGEHHVDVDPDCQESRNLQQKRCADPVQEIPIEDVIIHKGYKATSSNRRHDIALIRLKEEAKMSRYVKPICLPTPDLQDQIAKPDTLLTVAGWGRTETGEASKVKMKAGIPVISNKDCRQNYINISYRIYPQQICGSTDEQDACDGDSGGPLMDVARSEMYPRSRYFVAGVVSYGPRHCGDGSKPAVYTRVSSYFNWILSNLQP